jgi:hypothetical protein
MGEKAEVKRETNDARQDDRAREAAAALAATLNCVDGQEQGNMESNVKAGTVADSGVCK